jgi:hypothetical protein
MWARAGLATTAAASVRPKIASLKFLCRSADSRFFSTVLARKIPLSNDIRIEAVKYRNALTRKDLWAMSAMSFERRLCFVWRISAVGRGSSERGAGDPLRSERPLARQAPRRLSRWLPTPRQAPGAGPGGAGNGRSTACSIFPGHRFATDGGATPGNRRDPSLDPG